MSWEHVIIAALYFSGALLVSVLQNQCEEEKIADAWWLAPAWPLAAPIAIIVAVVLAFWRNLKPTSGG